MTVELEHEPGEKIQWDWLELRDTPWREPAYVLVGALSFSGRCRAVISEGMTFGHLVDAIDGVLRRLGGTPRAWRTDRMATVVHPSTDRISPHSSRRSPSIRRRGVGLPVAAAAAQGSR